MEIFFSKAKRELFLDNQTNCFWLGVQIVSGSEFELTISVRQKKLTFSGLDENGETDFFFPQKIKPPPRSATFRPRPDPTRRKAESPSLTPQGIRFLGRLRPDLTPRDRRSERLYVNTARFRSPGQLNTRKKKNALRNEPSPARKSRGGKK